MEATPTIARNAELQDLVPILQSQQDAKLDAVIPATAIRSEGGLLKIQGLSVFGDATIRPTEIMDGHIAVRLDIPVKYVRRMRRERPDLYDLNVNGWIEGQFTVDPNHGDNYPNRDKRNFLLRSFLPTDGTEGIGRALLSDSYKPVDHLDVLMAALDGVKQSGAKTEIVSTNLSETRMSVRFACPEISALAPTLLANYRSPVGGFNLASLASHYSPEHLGWDAAKGETPPVVFAGFEIDNSETGGGAFNITPVITVLACKNGLKFNAMAVRKIHLGSKLDEGVIKYSDDTRQKNVELIAAETRDTVATFISPEFIEAQIAKVEEKAGTPVDDVQKVIEVVGKKLAYSEEQQAGILSHFIQGGQMTAGGVLNAVTSYAQTVTDPDEAFDLEGSALQALELASA